MPVRGHKTAAELIKYAVANFKLQLDYGETNFARLEKAFGEILH